MQRNILITGVSSGIGLALAHHYLECGSKVYGVSRRKPESLLQHPNFSFHSIDLERLDIIASEISAFLAGQQHLDVVVLNAATPCKIAYNSDLL